MTIKKSKSNIMSNQEIFCKSRYQEPTSIIKKTLVRPHLENGNIIWGPHYKEEDQKALEKAQKEPQN